MMIKCDEHGFSNGLLVSPDIKEQIQNSMHYTNIITIDYEYKGDVVDSFYLSECFAQKYGFFCNKILTLPDDYPEWVSKLAPLCEKCFQKFTNFR
ncbi:hypothetical protein [Zooshikella ganghwensis]|uniref:Uncharacterized protein n=1 Tax=Zooshikella ganghwensis TaxID=202772 RepID=A0A4P9VFI3_9GAMM|nr:hypothetical protein [Zooshikella ganghwensis]RDH41773.1 hypothetical protein B9G39_26455 [Zooshikella ganghwensis]RDH41940.1 hypothetical protein B9G39_26365 [Zooshikella ganghwensis]